jgi:hypothetical protein
MEERDDFTSGRRAVQPLDPSGAWRETPIPIAQSSMFDIIPDEILLRIVYIAAEADLLGHDGPRADPDSPPSLGISTRVVSEVCTRWHAVIKGKSNESLWHLGVLLDLSQNEKLSGSHGLTQFKHRLSVSRGYTLHIAINYPSQATRRDASTSAHLGAVALHLLKPYHPRIASFHFDRSIPLLNPHSIEFSSCSRLQRLTIRYASRTTLESLVLDPHGILSFLYLRDSFSLPLKGVSHLNLGGAIQHTLSHLPTGPHVRQLVLSGSMNNKARFIECQGLVKFLLSNPSLRILEVHDVDLAWNNRTLPRPKAALQLEALTVTGKKGVALYLLLAFEFDRLEKVSLKLEYWSGGLDTALWSQCSFHSLRHVSMGRFSMSDQFMPFLSTLDELMLLQISVYGHSPNLSAIAPSRNLYIMWYIFTEEPDVSELCARLTPSNLDRTESFSLTVGKKYHASGESPATSISSQTAIPSRPKLFGAPLLQSLKLVFNKDMRWKHSYLSLIVTWINRFSAPKLQEAMFLVEMFDNRFSITLEFHGAEHMLKGEQQMIYDALSSASATARIRDRVSLDISLDFASRNARADNGSVDLVLATTSILRELDSKSKQSISIPALASLTLRLKGYHEDETAKLIKELLQSLKKSRSECRFPLKQVLLVRDGDSTLNI